MVSCTSEAAASSRVPFLFALGPVICSASSAVASFFRRSRRLSCIFSDFWDTDVASVLFPSFVFVLRCVSLFGGSLRLFRRVARRQARRDLWRAVAMKENSIHNVQCFQASIPVVINHEPLILFEFLGQNSHVFGPSSSGHCTIQLAVRKHRLHQINSNPCSECLALAFVDGHCP